VVERFGDLILEHPLRRELVATIVANDVVDSQGIVFVSRMMDQTGARAADVVRAFRIARDVVGAVDRWAAVEALDGRIDPVVQNELMVGVDWLVEATSRWYLVQAAGRALSDAVGEARDSFAELSAVIDQIGPDAWREEHDEVAERLVAQGAPAELARRHAFQPELVHGPDIIAVSLGGGHPVLDVARVFFLLGDRLEIDWLEAQAEELPAGSRWQRWAIQSVEDDLLSVRRELAEAVLDVAGAVQPDAAVESFLDQNEEKVERLRRFMRSLAFDGVSDLSQLTVAVRQIRSLVG
jgi:glutamate dehydrogenase